MSGTIPPPAMLPKDMVVTKQDDSAAKPGAVRVAPSSRRPLGYRPNSHTHRTRRSMFRAVPGSTPPDEWLELVPVAADVAPAWEQLNGSCTGHGSADGFAIAFAAAGDPLPFRPSPAELYRNGRAIDRVYVEGHPTQKLGDDGAMPAMVTLAANKFGIRPTKAADGVSSDDNVDPVNAEPTELDIEEEAIFLPIDEHGIEGVADGRRIADVVLELKRAISTTSYNGRATKGLPVGTGNFVDSAFMNWTGPSPQGACDTNDPNGGGHWTLFIAYRKGKDGRTEFLVKNSWGAGWGVSVQVGGKVLDGCIWVTEDWVAQSSDLTAYVPKKAEVS